MANKGESLGVYWGGFLLASFSPLEIYLNRCSHNCAYCFANLNAPDRQSNVKQALNLLKDLWSEGKDGKWKRKSYAAYLLREGYPVDISNRVDMLAASNWFQAKPIIETLVALNIPISYATRFGKPEWTQEFFDIETRTSSIYCSIPTLNAEIARKLEPGAPLPEQRLEYIKQAVSLGHTVNVGINPIIPGWIDDVDELVSAVKDAGAWGVFGQKLHFSCRQVKKMSDRQKELLGDAIDYGLNYKKRSECQALYDEVKASCKEKGLHFYNAQESGYTEYFTPALKLAPKSFPLMQEFVNTCYQELEDGALIYWEDFRDFFVPYLPRQEWGLRDHINALVVPQALYGKNIPQRMTYEKLLWYCWQHKETILCPANVDCLAWAGDPLDSEGNSWKRIVDDKKLPILVFKPNGTDNSCYTEEHSI